MLYHEPGLYCCPSSPWLSQTGVVPVHFPERVQFLWADPYRVNPSWQVKLCVAPTRNHWSLGQKSPWSSWIWAGHNTSDGRIQIRNTRFLLCRPTYDISCNTIQKITFARGSWHLSAIGQSHEWPLAIVTAEPVADRVRVLAWAAVVGQHAALCSSL